MALQHYTACWYSENREQVYEKYRLSNSRVESWDVSIDFPGMIIVRDIITVWQMCKII